ncbi:MAG: GGDEF domain-containing protein [Hahellaceae bacterium]|nr:GGDEF domain-containing protein [Hahellaceae bacterium]MCP5209815.1 GGDEF domain-containing protein [Hahellaceae bacterium]
MASGSNSKSELERLKNKYLSKAEEFDREEAALKQQIHLLQRMLVRVSLAADGQSESLDVEMSALRDLLRQEHTSSSALSQRLDKIESCVLKLDENRADTSDKLLDALASLADQLSSLEISRSNKKSLKSFSRQLKNKQEVLKNTPGLLSEYASLQKNILQEQFARVQGGKESSGFFQKLFGGKSDVAVKEAVVESDSATSTGYEFQPLEEDDSDAATDQRSYTENETELAVEGEIVPSDGQEAPGFAKISGHVGSSLRNLLEQLIIPENAHKEAERIRQKVEIGLNWYELGPTLDDVANLVIVSITKGQRDFENFLQSLDERLLKFQGFLDDALTHQINRRGAGEELNDSIRNQLQTLSSDVDRATDIDQLKHAVTGHLDSVLGSLSAFMSSEEGREQALRQQLDETRERLQQMEKESKVIKKKLKEERGRALTDTLTKLPNREAYAERYEFEFTRWQRYRQPVTMVVADIDFFKRVNDNYGHLAGDKVIQIMAKELQRRIRKTDFVARFGGEEFVVLMPETNVEQAHAVMEKTRQMVEKLPFHFRQQRVQITMSFGVAPFIDGLSKEEIFELADKALYEAKQQGRNRVVVAASN